MNDAMDINAGAIVDGTATVADVGEQVFRTILAVASGQETKSESMDYGEQEFVPGHIGTVMLRAVPFAEPDLAAARAISCGRRW